MATTVPPGQLELKNLLVLSLFEIVTHKCEKVLRHLLQWGTPRWMAGQSFRKYLQEVKKLSNAELRRNFNKSQREKLEMDLHGETFDVSLLYQCIQLGCDGLAPSNDRKWVDPADTLEHNITSIKNHRNDFVHNGYVINEKTYLQKIDEIMKLINSIFSKAAHVFQIDEDVVQHLLKEISNGITILRDRPFDATASLTLYDSLKILFKIEGRKELQEKYKVNSSISPVSNLTGKKISVDIKKIYTKLEIYKERSDQHLEELIELDRLLEYVEELNSKKTLLIVEGVAGAGKTTLTRKILNNWATGNCSMKNISFYDLAIWTECRDGGTRSLAQLLHLLMPNVTKTIQSDPQLIKSFQEGNNLIFIIDGLDEMNEASERVFRDILSLENSDSITIICTTRPNKLPDIKRYVPHTFKILHVKVIGISEVDREVFVWNYSQALALESELGSTDVSGLLQLLNKKESRLQEHWRLPFNLVLVTVLWILDNSVVNEMTTATELFVKTFELCQKRLIQRLFDNELTRKLSSQEISDRVSLFVKHLTKVAFISHYNDETVLSVNSVRRLKEVCKLLCLPPEEVMGAFLAQTISFIDRTLEKFSFPHKGLQDFFCAVHVEEALIADEMGMDSHKILFSYETILLEEKVPKHKIHSLLQMNRNELKKAHRRNLKNPLTIRSVLEGTFKDAAMNDLKQQETLELNHKRWQIPGIKLKRIFGRKDVITGKKNDTVVQFDFTKWRNILLHVTGLIYHRGRPVTENRAAELVKLLSESGVTDTEEWFDFLSIVKCDAAISKHIALTGKIKVTNCRVDAFLNVLNNADPTRVILDISGDPSEVPRLKELLMALREKSWDVGFWFHHDYRFPKEGGSVLDGTLRDLFRWSKLRVTWFKGQLSAGAVEELPLCLDRLDLSVKGDDHVRALLPALSSLMRRRPLLHNLELHLPTSLDESLLQPLPFVEGLELRLTDVDETTAEKTSRIIRALQPSGESYSGLWLPGILKKNGDYARLLEALEREEVMVGWGVYASPTLETEEDQKLKELTARTLGCYMETFAEDRIW